MRTVREEMRNIRERLGGLYDKRELEAVLLLIFAHVKGWGRVDLIMNEASELSEWAQKEIDNVVDRLILGEPIQYITGEARFYGMDLRVRPGVLIPRPETEELVDWIREAFGNSGDLSVLDIGTGTGCIAIALARNLAFAEVSALDLSEIALEVAKENARELKAKITFFHADMFEWMPSQESLDIIVSNPPYIAPDEKEDMEVRVKDYEPSEALFVSAEDPIRPYKRIEAIAAVGLRPGGAVFLELNPRFAVDVKEYWVKNGWDVEIRRDSYGKERMMKASRRS